MEITPSFSFPKETTFEKELASAMERIGSQGVTYPDGYYDALLQKYRQTGIQYPFALILAGLPRLRGHFAYSRILRQEGKFLDYGCGCGDSVRTLIRDGIPRDRIRAFDINRSGIDLGFDLYCDRDQLSDLFVVSASFPFEKESFGSVYSGLVIHCLGDEHEFREYLENACAALRPGGIFFGTTMGCFLDTEVRRQESRIRRVMTVPGLEKSLSDAGFTGLELVREPIMGNFAAYLVNACASVRIFRPALRRVFSRFPGCNNYNWAVMQFCAVKAAQSER